MKRFFSFVMLLAVVAMLVVACATPEQRAQKLFDEGKYEEVVAKFPNLPIAQNAKAKIAERMCEEGKYEEVVEAYGETQAATVARNMLAEKLFEEEKYEELCQTYPRTPAAKKAENILAEKLYEEGKLVEVIAKYPNTLSGVKAKNERGKEAYDKTKKMKKSQKEKALRDIIRMYAGSDAARQAQGDLAEIAKKSQKPTSTKKKDRSSSIKYGTSADDVIDIRGHCQSTKQLGSDQNGLIVAWYYTDVTYIMKRWTIGGVECYRVAEIR